MDTAGGAEAQPLSEDVLVWLWAGQRLPASAIKTADGMPLRVLHPGRRGRGAGPDFRDALIAPARGPLLRGDIELHVRATDFAAHGHHRDHAYDRVVLHVVFEGGGARETRLASGRRIPIVALAGWVRQRAADIAGWLATPPLWREPCADALARLGEEGVLRRITALGEERFEARTEELRLTLTLHGESATLYLALLDGLGYGGAREYMALVAERLPWHRIEEALAQVPAERRAKVAESVLSEAACGLAAPSVRPGNRPSRRLEGLAALLARHWPLDATSIEEDSGGLIALWTVADRVGPGPVGRSRAIELLANAVLPWQAARCRSRGDGEGARRAGAAFAALPSPGRYGRLAFLEANLSAGGKRLRLDARAQQGLLALYKADCTQGGCGRCILSPP